MAGTSGSFTPPSVAHTGGGGGGGGAGTDDQQLQIVAGQLVLEDGGTPIDLDQFGDNDELTDAFGNPIPQ